MLESIKMCQNGVQLWINVRNYSKMLLPKRRNYIISNKNPTENVQGETVEGAITTEKDEKLGKDNSVQGKDTLNAKNNNGKKKNRNKPPKRGHQCSGADDGT